MYCTPHERFFRPDHEILPLRGHRSGGLSSQLCFKFYKGKHGKLENDNDLPEDMGPAFKARMAELQRLKTVAGIKRKRKEAAIKKARAERAAALKEERKKALKKRALSEGKNVDYYDEDNELEEGRPKSKIRKDGPKSRLGSKPGDPYIRRKAALLSSHINQVKDPPII